MSEPTKKVVSPTNLLSRLPAVYVERPFARLRRKDRAKSGRVLPPFVAIGRTKTNTPCWDIPATGGYLGGFQTGEAMALAYLKFLRENQAGRHASFLADIAESLMKRYEEEGGAAMEQRGGSAGRSEGFDSLRGQYAGFFNTLGQWLSACAKDQGGNLDRLLDADILAHANEGLGFDAPALMKSPGASCEA